MKKESKGANAEVHALLETIGAKEKKIAKRLRPAAPAAALETLRRLEAPDLLVALYAAHDGSEDEIFGPYALLPVEQIVDERATMNELLAANPRWKTDGIWDASFLPFMADGDGQYYLVDPKGLCDDGVPGQVLFYDHEVGPERAARSVAAFLGLVTSAAKKKLLSLEAWEEREEELDELRSEAKLAGLPKMTKKERAALDAALEGGEDEPTPGPEARLAILEPYLRRFGADESVLRDTMWVAAELERWPTVLEAAGAGIRLARRDEKNVYTRPLFAALYHSGKVDAGLEAYRDAMKRVRSVNESRTGLIPEGLDPATRRRALDILVEHHPGDTEAWWLLATESPDPAERHRLLEKVVAMVAEASYPSSTQKNLARAAKRLLEHARIEGFSPAARLAALLAFAESTDEGKSAELWAEAASLALELGDLGAADRATARQLENVYDFQHVNVCELRLRVLHALGRDAEGLALLDAALGHVYCGSEDCFRAIPWGDERASGKLVRDPAKDALLAACFAKITDRAPENLDAWRWRRTFATGAELRGVLEHLVAYTATELARKDEDGNPYWGEDGSAELRVLGDDCRAQLARA